MKNFYFLLISSLFLTSGLYAGETDYTQGLSIWFDTPNTLQGYAAWYGGRPDLWKDENKPVTAGSGHNLDASWESQSLPIGNGSLGANIMGSVEAERITFNEKTLWRGGPNTAKGADYYWNVNKQSAHLLDEIRKAFTEGDQKKAEMLTRQNFNSEVSYEADGENPFRFSSFTTMGEFYVETGLNMIGMSDYKRILSLDSAMAVVQFKKDRVAYQRNFFISYPANVMVVRFSADQSGKQNLVFSYAPNPLSTGSMVSDGNKGLVYTASLDNNGMKYVVRIQAETKGGTLSNADGNFGGTAGITEMLLQSHMGFIQLLPALPDAWKDGSISGICAKGNFEVDMIWENHQLKEAVVRSNAGGNCVIKYLDQTISFKTVKGRSYQIGYDAAKGLIKN